MNRKLISKAISDIDASFIAESMSPPVVKTDHAPERTSNMGKYENKRNGVNSRRLISLILAAATVLTLTACNQNPNANLGGSSPTNPTSSTNPTEPGELAEVYKIANYTGTAEAVIANRDVVVGTLNGLELTNSTLQIYYWLDVYDFIANYDAASYGLDISKPLDTQKVGSGTWQQYFLGSALSSWNYHQALALAAEAEQVQLNPYYQKLLDNMADELTQSALEEGFDSVEAMIQSDVGPGATTEDYYRHRRILYAAQNYCYAKLNAMNFTPEQIQDYYTANEASLIMSGIDKNTGDSHRVRHILFKINDKATDADWENLRIEAQAMLDQWLAGEATEESFAALALENSDDPGSCSYGGLYQGLTGNTSFLQPFKEWYMDESRQVGDYGLVKTTAGYHIMYYSGTEPIWYYYCREMMVSDEMEKIETAALETYAATIYYDKILLGEVTLVEDK